MSFASEINITVTLSVKHTLLNLFSVVPFLTVLKSKDPQLRSSNYNTF